MGVIGKDHLINKLEIQEGLVKNHLTNKLENWVSGMPGKGSSS